MVELVYNLFDKDGRIVMEGTAKELAKELKISSPSSITQCCKRGQRLCRKYTLKEIGPVHILRPKPTDHQKKLQYIVWHLKYKGGVTSISKDNPVHYEQELKDMGINITWEKSIYDKKSYVIKRI